MTPPQPAGQPPVTGPSGTVPVPVAAQRTDRSRPLGAFAIRADGTVSFVPVVDPQRLAWCAVAGFVAVAVAAAAGAATRGRGPSIGAVRMGPGGWVSLKRRRAFAPVAPAAFATPVVGAAASGAPARRGVTAG